METVEGQEAMEDTPQAGAAAPATPAGPAAQWREPTALRWGAFSTPMSAAELERATARAISQTRAALAAGRAPAASAAPAAAADSNDGVLQVFRRPLGRSFDADDPAGHAVRAAESIFLRRLHERCGRRNITIQSIDHVRNAETERKFQAKKSNLRLNNRPTHEVLMFHGTQQESVDSILRNNFNLSMCVMNAYGPGVYFSEDPTTSLIYGPALILCRVLPGRVQVPRDGDRRLRDGQFDSFLAQAVNPDQADDPDAVGNIHVISDPDQILPYCVYHFADLLEFRRENYQQRQRQRQLLQQRLQLRSLRTQGLGLQAQFQQMTNPQHQLQSQQMGQQFMPQGQNFQQQAIQAGNPAQAQLVGQQAATAAAGQSATGYQSLHSLQFQLMQQQLNLLHQQIPPLPPPQQQPGHPLLRCSCPRHRQQQPSGQPVQSAAVSSSGQPAATATSSTSAPVAVPTPSPAALEAAAAGPASPLSSSHSSLSSASDDEDGALAEQ